MINHTMTRIARTVALGMFSLVALGVNAAK